MLENKIEYFGDDLETALGIPTAYYKFDSPVGLPYATYMFGGDDGLHSDDVNYIKREKIIVELYFKDKNFELEKRLTDFFIDNGLAYSSSADQYIDEDDMFAKIYETGMFYQ